MSNLVRAIIVIALLWLVASCSLFDRRNDAESIERQIRAMPSVADTDMTYNSDFTAGKHFQLTVSLAPSVTEAHASDVGRTFVDQMTRQGFGDHDVGLDLHYPATLPQPNDYWPDYSTAAFKFGTSNGGSDPTAADISDSIAAWLRATRSPIAQRVYLGQPPTGESGSTRSIDITLRQEATAAQAQALQRNDPALATASWVISIARDKLYRPHDYTSTPAPPSDRDKTLWTEISDIVGPRPEARGDAREPVGRPAQAGTEIEISGPSEETQRITRAVAALLPQFGRPVALVVHGQDGKIELLVGGCYRHGPDHQRLPLELELSAVYERC